jgi:hypothetical protein
LRKQAYTNVVLTLLDESDPCVLFAPYYFNHLMAHQMTGGAASVVLGPCDPATLHPDLDWLEVIRRVQCHFCPLADGLTCFDGCRPDTIPSRRLSLRGLSRRGWSPSSTLAIQQVAKLATKSIAQPRK